MKELQNNKVVLGLSGGVDSTTAALLLKEKGYEVIGLFLDVMGDGSSDIEAAAKAAEQLDIPFVHRDVSDIFEKVVISDFCREYSIGHTPNPCVVCNPNVKFKTIIDVADELGAYYIATGHYARIINRYDRYYVQQAASLRKDQSYMLYRLGQDILSRIIFPLGNFQDKEETRNLAKSHKLFSADKADSQEICFIEDGKKAYVDFIEDRGFHCEQGDFIYSDGSVIGKHKGLLYYTVGQRKGLGLNLGKSAFVTKIDPAGNTITLGSNKDLFKENVVSHSNFFVADSTERIPETVDNDCLLAKIRYGAGLSPCTLKAGDNGRVIATFDIAQRAATPGQSIVFYAKDSKEESAYVIGGGLIESDY